MFYSYFLTREAKEDLWRIYEFGVHRFGDTQADKYFSMLHECFEKIYLKLKIRPKSEYICDDFIVFNFLDTGILGVQNKEK